MGEYIELLYAVLILPVDIHFHSAVVILVGKTDVTGAALIAIPHDDDVSAQYILKLCDEIKFLSGVCRPGRFHLPAATGHVRTAGIQRSSELLPQHAGTIHALHAISIVSVKLLANSLLPEYIIGTRPHIVPRRICRKD